MGDFISKGEKLMSDPNCPTFLEGHVQKLKEAWEDTNEKAQARKTGLMDNLKSWDAFETMTVEAHKQLDQADVEFKSIKKIFDLNTSGDDYGTRMKTAEGFRKSIEDVVATVTNANNIIQENLPEEKKKNMLDRVENINDRI